MGGHLHLAWDTIGGHGRGGTRHRGQGLAGHGHRRVRTCGVQHGRPRRSVTHLQNTTSTVITVTVKPVLQGTLEMRAPTNTGHSLLTPMNQYKFKLTGHDAQTCMICRHFAGFYLRTIILFKFKWLFKYVYSTHPTFIEFQPSVVSLTILAPSGTLT